MMKLWIDDVRPAPEGYVWALSVIDAKHIIENAEKQHSIGCTYFYYGPTRRYNLPLNLIDIDYDAGEYVCQGGDYIKLLDWLEETGRSYPIRIHSQNPVGMANMRAIVERNGWKEIR